MIAPTKQNLRLPLSTRQTGQRRDTTLIYARLVPRPYENHPRHAPCRWTASLLEWRDQFPSTSLCRRHWGVCHSPATTRSPALVATNLLCCYLSRGVVLEHARRTLKPHAVRSRHSSLRAGSRDSRGPVPAPVHVRVLAVIPHRSISVSLPLSSAASHNVRHSIRRLQYRTRIWSSMRKTRSSWGAFVGSSRPMDAACAPPPRRRRGSPPLHARRPSCSPAAPGSTACSPYPSPRPHPRRQRPFASSPRGHALDRAAAPTVGQRWACPRSSRRCCSAGTRRGARVALGRERSSCGETSRSRSTRRRRCACSRASLASPNNYLYQISTSNAGASLGAPRAAPRLRLRLDGAAR
ncbi:hypothetical protein C8R47DRAFT_1136424 [Mycena vitilis]|nr:hypothetical protein C8R47DRAFT_1136424 [Mycena vitilis]